MVSDSRRGFLLNCSCAVAGAAALGGAAKAVAADISYKYDDRGRVIQVNYPDGIQIVYSYDLLGNRIQVSRSNINSATVITVPEAPSNLRTLANNAGYAGGANANYQFVVLSGKTVPGTGGGTGAIHGGVAIDTGIWPAGSILSLVVSGNVHGGGGRGGNGSAIAAGADGGNGGHAVFCQAPISITVNSGGAIKGGGGGGGGGSYSIVNGGNKGGGGGGGGFPNGGSSSGATGPKGTGGPGLAGSTSAGGAGGVSTPAGNGGAGGNAGLTGMGGFGEDYNSNGGTPGYAINKNGNTVSVSNSGTIAGTVG